VILAYPPILRGFLALLVAGLAFPITGVIIVRMNLITLRFAMMHGALLGGAIAVASGIHPLGPTLLVNAVIVAAVGRISRRTGVNLGAVTTMVMAVSVAGAAALTYRLGVPAKDTLAVLWGNIYALRPADLLIVVLFGIVLIAATVIGRRRLVAMMFSREIAFVSGINEPLAYYAILFGVAATVAVAMRILGALLLDVLVILPALVAGRIARSLTSLFLLAGAAGVVASAGGFFISIGLDIPASTGIALAAVTLLGITEVVAGRTGRRLRPT